MSDGDGVTTEHQGGRNRSWPKQTIEVQTHQKVQPAISVFNCLHEISAHLVS